MRSSRIGLCLAVLGLVGSASYGDEPQIRVVTDRDQRPVAVEAIGWRKDDLAAIAKRPDDDYLRGRLRVYVQDTKGNIQLPQIAGQYEVVPDGVRFTPQFKLQPGLSYEAHFLPTVPGPEFSPSLVKKEFNVPAPPPTEPTRITAVYPSASTLPENQLRFYIHFSAPMSAGESYRHIKLLKADGQPVNKAFYELREELWDGVGQRFTLLCDPGRVKKGLKPREEFGPVCEAGQSYRLAIDKDWRDERGRPLTAGFEKRFTAGPAVETAVDWKQWKVSAPVAPSRDPLVVRFDRPLDRALLMRMVTVANATGTAVDGTITVGDEERRWEFRPDQPWSTGKFALVVDTALEDSAGNNLARPFEIDVFDEVDKTSAPELIRIPFAVTTK